MERILVTCKYVKATTLKTGRVTLNGYVTGLQKLKLWRCQAWEQGNEWGGEERQSDEHESKPFSSRLKELRLCGWAGHGYFGA